LKIKLALENGQKFEKGCCFLGLSWVQVCSSCKKKKGDGVCLSANCQKFHLLFLITKGQSSNRKEGEEEEKGRRRRRRRRRFVPQEEEEEEEEEEEAEIFCPSNINLIIDYAKQKNSPKAAITLHITQSFNLSLDKNGMDKKVNPRKKRQRV
jgi:hypothetical protein